MESTSSGRRIRKRNLNECTPSGSNRTKKSKTSRKSFKRKSSKAKTSRPQRTAARNARNMLSQMDEISTDEEDVDPEDDSSDSLQYSDIPSEPERKIQDKGEELKQPPLDGLADLVKPPPHSGSQANNANRRRLVLKFSLRDSKKNVSSEDMRNACDTQADTVCQSSRSQDSTEKSTQDRSSINPALSFTDVTADLPQSHIKSEDTDAVQTENPINDLNGSMCVEGNTVQCKEQKIDAPRSADAMLTNHVFDDIEQNANGYVKF